jgi:methionyl-tRNA formyltransferase
MTTRSEDRFPDRPRLIFMGTPEFAVPTLKALIDHGHDIAAVATQPDRPKGRGRKTAISPVKSIALEHGIEVLQPERASDEQFCERVKNIRPELIIVVAFGQILRKHLLTIPKRGVINIHASILPKYRGAAPIQWAILNNESATGLTIMRMDEGLDTGPILLQDEIPVLKDATAARLHTRLALMAGELIIKFLSLMADNPLEEVSQDDSLATYAPKIERDMCLIDWEDSATRVSSLIRALDPKPGAHTLLQGKQIKLFSPRVEGESGPEGIPGRVAGLKGGLHVETGKGQVEIREIQYPGKKRLPAHDFLRGFSIPVGTVLGK